MILDKHWWRTPAGRLVPEGEAPDGSTLAYPRGHEVPDNLAQQIGLTAAVEAAEAGAKEAAKPADKMAARPADKAAEARRPPTSGPGSGADAWRRYAAVVTDSPPESWANLSREEIIERLDSETGGKA